MFPFLESLANLGFTEACQRLPALALGVTILDGHVTNKAVAEAHRLAYVAFSPQPA